MITDEIRAGLIKRQDIKYRDFQAGLIPDTDSGSFIGVRTPELRSYAKELSKRAEVSDFLSALPHRFFDENQLHAFIISEIKDYELCLNEVKRFLPYVDNWATCDQMSPGVFKKHRDALLPEIRMWIRADKTYTVRFGIRMLMNHFLDDRFDPSFPEMVSRIRTDEYYVRMMAAWYFATALAKQYEQVLPYIENRVLDEWTHQKTIQKAVESFRITPEQKAYLKQFRIPR